MKIRIHSPSGYCCLEGLEFPMELEAHRNNAGSSAFVEAHLLRVYGVETDDSDFVFLEEEYTLVEDSPTSSEDRKGLLIQLVQDYGVAINNGCYESACGSVKDCENWVAEENRLLAEIIKMINDGV